MRFKKIMAGVLASVMTLTAGILPNITPALQTEMTASAEKYEYDNVTKESDEADGSYDNADSSDQSESIGIKAGNVECKAGETVDVPLYVFGTSKCSQIELKISADAPLVIQDCSNPLVYSPLADNEWHVLYFSFSHYFDSKSFSEIKITVPYDIEPGDYSIDIEIISMDDGGVLTENPLGISGYVKVLPEPTYPFYYDYIDKDKDGVYDYIEITDCDESVTEIDIPAEIDCLPIKSIRSGAFSECYDLESVTIPDSVTSIGEEAFLFCENLIIYGYKDSTAQAYAEKYGYKFESIGEYTSSWRVADIIALQNFLLKKTDSIGKYYDLNNDGKLNVFDLVILKRKVIYGT